MHINVKKNKLFFFKIKKKKILMISHFKTSSHSIKRFTNK